jgi:hypothetical protein
MSWREAPRRALAAVGRFETLGLRMGDWPGDRAATAVNLSQIALWNVLGIWVLVATGHFTYDQAYFYEMSVRVAESLRPAAYGPFVSGFHPAPLTPGGLLYDLYAVPFLVARDPRWGMAWIHLLVAGGTLLFDRALRRLGAPPALRIAAVALQTWGLFHARLTSTFWNGDLFLATTPLTLYIAVRSVDAKRSQPLWGAAFGLVCALAVQTHLSGALACAVCLAMLLVRRGGIDWRWASAAAVVFAASYLPYFITESSVGGVDGQLLSQAVPKHWHLSGRALVHSLVTPVFYASHAEHPREMLPPFLDWPHWVFGLSALLSLPWVVLGALARFPAKLSSVLGFVLLPTFLLVTARQFFHHYAAPLIAFESLFAAAGLAVALSHQGAVRWVAAGYLCAFVVSGAAILAVQRNQPVLSPDNPFNGLSVSVQESRTEQLLALGRPIPSTPGGDLAFVYSVLAKRLFDRRLEFSVMGETCTTDIVLSGVTAPLPHATRARLLPLAANSAYVCPSSDDERR